MRGYQDYNKEQLLNIIDKISITKEGTQVITKFGERVIKVTNVSNRYEIFNISGYLKNKIELIEKNFTISKYKFDIIGGKQYLQLISDSIQVGGVDFHKSFYILNSSDKSRRLSFNVGLYSDTNDLYVIGASNTGLIKKHLKGGELKYDAKAMGLIPVYDMQSKGYRRVNSGTILSLNIGKKKYEVIPDIGTPAAELAESKRMQVLAGIL
jgi:hypothetical protein